MGAYVVLAGIGLFDMQGGCAAIPEYQISGPAFARVTRHLRTADLRIVAEHNSPTNVYIQSASLNGRPLSRLAVSDQDLQRGGELHLVMGPHPVDDLGPAHP